MTIHKLQSGKLLIWMKNEELSRFGLSFNELNEDDEVTRRFLRRLVAASSPTLIPCRHGCVVEALPGSDEWLLVISPIHRRRTYRIKRTSTPIVYRFLRIDDLLDAYSRVDGLCRIPPKAQVLNGFALLRFHAPLSRAAMHLLAEYGERLSDVQVAALCEHQVK